MVKARKIKHWSGYGYMNIQKTFDKKIKGKPEVVNGYVFQYDYHRHIQFRLTGLHERGLVPDGKYDMFRWLIMKFDRGVTLDNVHRVSMMADINVTPMSYDGDDYLVDVSYNV